jgi:hypothetical protein
MGLVDFLFYDTLHHFRQLVVLARDSAVWAIQLTDESASRMIQSTLRSVEHIVLPTVSAAFGHEVGMLRIIGEEMLISAVKLFAAAALVFLLLCMLPREVRRYTYVALCVAVLLVEPLGIELPLLNRAAPPAPSPTPPFPTPHIICTPPLVNDTGRCDCPVGLKLEGSKNCVCPPAHTFDGSRCHECLWPREVHKNECACPHPQVWTGDTCRCLGQLKEGGGGCVCPAGMVQRGADRCVPHMHDGTVNYLRVRADWSADSIKACRRGGSCFEAGGDGGKEVEWFLHDEAIVGVQWWWGDSVMGIQVTLTNGTTLFHGDTDATPHYEPAPPGKALVGFELQDHRPIKYFGACRVLKHLRPIWG